MKETIYTIYKTQEYEVFKDGRDYVFFDNKKHWSVCYDDLGDLYDYIISIIGQIEYGNALEILDAIELYSQKNNKKIYMLKKIIFRSQDYLVYNDSNSFSYILLDNKTHRQFQYEQLYGMWENFTQHNHTQDAETTKLIDAIELYAQENYGKTYDTMDMIYRSQDFLICNDGSNSCPYILYENKTRKRAVFDDLSELSRDIILRVDSIGYETMTEILDAIESFELKTMELIFNSARFGVFKDDDSYILFDYKTHSRDYYDTLEELKDNAISLISSAGYMKMSNLQTAIEEYM